jgi:hypothetical protein
VQTRSEIKRLLRRFSITSLYVTHDQVEAIALADQIVVMHEGRIEQVGTYHELMENPVNLFVAGFLGLPPMSLLSGGFISGNRLVLGDYLIPLPERVFPLVQNNQPVTLGMRQEAVNLSTEIASRNGVHLPADPIVRSRLYPPYPDGIFNGKWTIRALSFDIKFRLQQVHAQLDPERLYSLTEPAADLRFYAANIRAAEA